MKIFDSVLQNINNGKIGLNEGLDSGLERLKNYMPNIQRANFYLIGGETSTGKSAFALETFLYNPYNDWIKKYRDNIDFHAFVWSMEMDKHIVLTKAICRKVFMDYQILIDVNFVLSRGKNRISGEIYELILKTTKYFEEFEDYITILNNDNPTGIRNTIRDYMLAKGKDTYKEIPIIDSSTGKNRVVYDKYIPNDLSKLQYTICICDHIGLTKTERGFIKKQTIDKLVEYLVDYRDRYYITPVLIQQFNRTLSSTDRFKLDRVMPQISDFKESSDPTDAANFVFALFSPSRYEMKEFRGYLINPAEGGLGDRYKHLQLLKCRDGNSDIHVGLGFLGEIGHFSELPKADKMTEDYYNYIRSFTKITNSLVLT